MLKQSIPNSRDFRDILQLVNNFNCNGVVVDIQAGSIRRALKAHDISQPQFASRVDMSYDQLNKYLSGRRNLRAEEAERIKAELNKLGEPIFGNSWLPQPEPSNELIPIYGYSIKNAGLHLELTMDSVLGQTVAHPAQSNYDKCFAVELNSDDYAPRYFSGELVYAIWNKPPSKHQDCLIELKSGGCDLMRFQSLSGSELIVEHTNKSNSKAYRLNDIARLHAIVGSGRR